MGVLAVWILLVVATVQSSIVLMQEIQARVDRGDPVTEDELMYDGVGENFGAVCIGWAPGAAYCLLLLVVRALVSGDIVRTKPRRRRPA